jgi:hypothetical protein
MDVVPRQLHPFLAEGTVVEVLEDRGQQRARIILRAGVMLDLPASSVPDVHLGAQFDIGGVITVEFLSPKPVTIVTDPRA